MTEIIAFPRKKSTREGAIERLATKLVAHFSASLYQKRILADVPLVNFIDRMCVNMINDGFDYDPAVLDAICENANYLDRIERALMKHLVEEGYLPSETR